MRGMQVIFDKLEWDEHEQAYRLSMMPDGGGDEIEAIWFDEQSHKDLLDLVLVSKGKHVARIGRTTRGKNKGQT